MKGTEMIIERKQREIDDLISRALEYVHTGKSKFHGMSYEEGIVAALEWVTGESDEDPMAD